MFTVVDRKSRRILRRERLRKKLSGTSERPRLAVFRSLRHISVQLIDDATGTTLACAATIDPELKDAVKGKKKTEQAVLVGKKIAEKAMAAGINRAVFDRGGNKYHGRVKALCEAAREAGLAI
ncbi:MAG: 50S ribosomal protein L18 [bacterium]|jgi:large subunit ribosomal protein L18